MARLSVRRRLQVRLRGALYEAAEQVAEKSGVALGSFVGLLVEDALATQPKTVPQALVGRGDAMDRALGNKTLDTSPPSRSAGHVASAMGAPQFECHHTQ
jgi:hypothetical protein